MNHREAKLISQACRPGEPDAADPMFAEALEQARRDPQLQTWFHPLLLQTRQRQQLQNLPSRQGILLWASISIASLLLILYGRAG